MVNNNNNSSFQVDFTWIILLGLIFLLGTGREPAEPGESIIIT